MIELFSAISALARLLPQFSAGAIPTAAMPGDTDGMAPAVPVPATAPVPDPPRRASDPIIDRTTLRLGPGQYLRQETPKRQIVLHFTAGGTARGAFDTWVADPRTVATAYIVGTDGLIYETFDPKYWAFALGVKGSAARPAEQAAIQIEIVGWGPLKLRGDMLCSWPADWSKRYCTLDETHRYVKQTFRGIHYFSSYPDAQIAAVTALVGYLCRRFQIPAVVAPPSMRGVANVAQAAAFRGIVAHENYRQDKWDVGPAFPWDRLQGAIR